MYIPAQEMGDYEEKRPKKKSSGALYPLDEEGTYGRPPSQASRAPASQPAYPKRERKPKVYASYAVSSDCSMHAAKLEKNESASNRRRGDTPPRGGSRQSLNRSSSFRAKPSRSRDSATPTPRSRDSATPTPRSRDSATPSRTKWQNTLRETSYTPNPGRWQETLRGSDMNSGPRWQDSLRGRDSVSPSTPNFRRSSTQPRRQSRAASSSVSPNRSRTISASPDRQRKMQSPVERRRSRGSSSGDRRTSSGDRRRASAERGQRSSTDWGYTDFSTFTANRKSVDNSSSVGAYRKTSQDRKTSTSSLARKDSSAAGGGGERRRSSGAAPPRDSFSSGAAPPARDSFSPDDRRLSSSFDYAASSLSYTNNGNQDYSSSVSRDYSMTRDYSSSVGRDYSSSVGRDYNNSSMQPGSHEIKSSSKIGLSALKSPTLTDWDQLGVLGLSSKMFNDSTSFKESYVTSSSSSFRRESVTTKVM